MSQPELSTPQRVMLSAEAAILGALAFAAPFAVMEGARSIDSIHQASAHMGDASYEMITGDERPQSDER